MAPRVTHVHSASVSDRRRGGRFPLREEIRYRVLRANSDSPEGCGKTIDMGSGGVLFTTDIELPHGRLVEISVNWPARLGGVCPLKFVAVGRVVRSDAISAAVRIQKYEFKTRKATA
jgi:hypothetical protein